MPIHALAHPVAIRIKGVRAPVRKAVEDKLISGSRPTAKKLWIRAAGIQAPTCHRASGGGDLAAPPPVECAT